ncbi:hypothetical protein H6F96_29500 [Microcoleus sp. FACHB-53]|nr:hypothetical protein [Microcoleus sp. FACHB-53]MBD2129022.1 hypothetical protein [Microcoleus sp. FACHB-1]
MLKPKSIRGNGAKGDRRFWEKTLEFAAISDSTSAKYQPETPSCGTAEASSTQNVDWGFPIYIKRIVSLSNDKLGDLANPIQSNRANYT